jgi:hypothetical protein
VTPPSLQPRFVPVMLCQPFLAQFECAQENKEHSQLVHL